MTLPRTITVAIPAYNAEEYVCEALDSVAAQSRSPDQTIVVDDGSTDGTAGRVREWAALSRLGVKLLQQENGGPSRARNTALRHATTDLIALLDADDLFLPHHLDLVSKAFERRDDIVLCFADGESFGHSGVPRASLLAGTRLETLRYEEYPGGLRVISGSAYSSLLWGSYVPVGATIFRRDAAEKVGLYNEGLRAEDRDFYLRLSRVGRFAYYPRIVHRKRMHAENQTHPKNMERYRRYQLMVLQKMLGMAGELGLSQDEVRETLKAIGEQVWIMLYHASENGVSAYIEMCDFLWKRGVRGPLINPRHWLRAAAFSTVLDRRFR